MTTWYAEFRKDLIAVLLAMMVLNAIVSIFGFWKDDSDGEKRSGLTVHVDALTGCQYLSKGNNFLPRTDHTGRQVCTTR